ncbi:Tryptophan decarboxylase TDC1-like protein [Drosera capensis]
MESLGPNSNDISPFNPLDPEEFRAQAHSLVDFIADYYNNVQTYPVLSKVEPGFLTASLPKTAPYRGESFEQIMDDVRKFVLPGMCHWVSPNFFAYFPATVSTAAFLGEMMCAAFNCVGFNWLASPAATEMEMVVLDWLAGMLGLPKSFMFSGSGGGVIQGTTSESIICTLVAARERALSTIGSRNMNKLVVYGSDQTHSTYTKACKLVGISPKNIRLIPTTLATSFSMSADILRATIQSDVASGLVPLYLCVTVGTTSTTAVDPVDELVHVTKDYNVWVHVDAAYAGSACICPEFRHYLGGVERADSLSLGPHKWLLSGLDCCCLWVRHPGLLVKALGSNPEYLRNGPSEKDSVVDYKDWQIGTGRRFRSIRLWFVLRSYGVANLQYHIRSDVKMAKVFEGWVRLDPRFEVVVPTRFALVCFRLNPVWKRDKEEIEGLNRKLLDWVNSTGAVYMTHTVVGGVYMLRFAVGATLTEHCHVAAAWKLIKEGADALGVKRVNGCR